MHALHLVVSPPRHMSTATATAAFRPQAQAQVPTQIPRTNTSQATNPAPTRTTTTPSPRLTSSELLLRQTLRSQVEVLERLRENRARLGAEGPASASYGASSGTSLPGVQGGAPGSGTSSLGGDPSSRHTAAASASTNTTPLFYSRHRGLFNQRQQLNQGEDSAVPIRIGQHDISPSSTVYLLQDQFGRPHSLLVGPARSVHAPPSLFTRVVPDNAIPPARYNPAVHPIAAQPPPFDLEELRRLLHNQPRPRRLNLRHLIRDRATHLWLALKLTVFVVLFTGNGGWHRTLCVGSIAVVIFICQTGILNGVLRPLVEAVYPQPPVLPTIPADGNGDPQQQQPLNPADTAQLLINRQEDRARDVIRNIERAVVIFMASLVPGWHDRHVNAIERQQEEVRLREQREREEGERGEQPQPAEARGVEVVEGVL